MKKKVEHTLDQEWLLLIKEAKNLGMSKEEVKVFLLEKAQKNKV
ncbi:anti-repressor SinI family protein [Salirhabdus sp. Marseille-P4669]|nr:anti-repressor SinI family protein [Salirhabdus sp. Marseille-P4669]